MALKQLDIITTFTNDIGMKFSADKCAYLNIEWGQRTLLDKKIDMNGLELSELEDGDSYKYLGMDEDVQYQGRLRRMLPRNIITGSVKSGAQSYTQRTKYLHLTVLQSLS